MEPALLSQEAKRKGFVMYGYPRTAAQVEHLLKVARIDALYVLDFSLGVSMHKLIERCCLRRVDPETDKVYSLADHDTLDGLSADIKSRLVVPDGDKSEDKIQKRIELFVQNSAEVCSTFRDEIVHVIDADRNALTILHDIGVIAFGEEVAATYGEQAAAANRDETLCKKLAWSLRDQYHEHAPEVEVDNSEHFDEDPDLHAKRHSADNGKHERPLTVLHFNDVYEIKEGKQEPVGGAHRDKNLILINVRESILKNLNLFQDMSAEEILDQRKNKFLKIGRNKGFTSNPESLSTLENKTNIMSQLLNKNKKNIYYISGFLLLTAILMIYFL